MKYRRLFSDFPEEGRVFPELLKAVFPVKVIGRHMLFRQEKYVFNPESPEIFVDLFQKKGAGALTLMV